MFVFERLEQTLSRVVKFDSARERLKALRMVTCKVNKPQTVFFVLLTFTAPWPNDASLFGKIKSFATYIGKGIRGETGIPCLLCDFAKTIFWPIKEIHRIEKRP